MNKFDAQTPICGTSALRSSLPSNAQPSARIIEFPQSSHKRVLTQFEHTISHAETNRPNERLELAVAMILGTVFSIIAVII